MMQDALEVEFARIKGNLHLLLDQHDNEFGHFKDPVHLDLHLAASQNVLYRDFLRLQSASGPMIRALGAHYFAYDRTRLTKIVAPASVIQKQFSPALPLSDAQNETDIIFLNHLVMMTYRQIFRERRTLNGWLLRMSEADFLGGEGRFDLLILEDAAQVVSLPKEESICISEALASLLIPDVFIDLFKEIIIKHWNHYRRCIGATERFGVAAALFEEVRKADEQIRIVLPALDIVDNVSEYRQAEDRIRNILRFPQPSRSRSQSREKEIRRDLFKMLQSTVLYLRLYDACHFVSLTTRASGFPYGVTLLTAEVLAAGDIADLHGVIEQVGQVQHDAVANLLCNSNRPRLPEHLALAATNIEFRNYPGAEIIWSQLIDSKRIPGYALAVFLKVIESAAAMRVENRHLHLAFVLSQSSYLESVGFVALEELNSATRNPSYLELVDNSRERALIEEARFYELDRWETGRGILPYDLVHSITPSERINGNNLDSFLKKITFPDSSAGFHLLDLDAYFVYPQIGINCVRRLGTGIIGRFQEGAPPGGNSYNSYAALSGEINRFVAGIIDDGSAILIFDGRIWAEFTERNWCFYNHESARAVLDGSVKNIDRTTADSVLNTTQRLCMNRHGAIVVLTNLTRTEWEAGKGHGYFLPRHDNEAILDRFDEDIDTFIRLSEADGCCIIGRDRELLGYGHMINVKKKIPASAEKLIKELSDAGKGARHHHAALLSIASGWPVICISEDGPATLLFKAEATRLFPSSDLDQSSDLEVNYGTARRS